MNNLLRYSCQLASFSALIFVLSGCGGSLFSFNVEVVGEQTALERQVLGSYADIGSDLSSYSSVRGVDPQGDLQTPPEVTDSQRDAFAALRNQDYNSDDVRALLVAGIAGEKRDGLLEQRNPVPEIYFLEKEQVDSLIKEENADRGVLFQRLLDTVVSAEDQTREIQNIFARINQEKAPTGSLIQNADGNWVKK